MASEGLLSPTSHFAAAAPPQSMHYPSVVDLEVAGKRLAACALQYRTCLSCRTAGMTVPDTYHGMHSMACCDLWCNSGMCM